MDGMELAEQVHAKWPHVRLLISWGYARPRPDEIPDHGRFVPKPYHAAPIVREIYGTRAHGEEVRKGSVVALSVTNFPEDDAGPGTDRALLLAERKATYLRLSLSNTLGWLVDVPDVPEGLVVLAAVLRERPRMKYQIRAARIARPRMIQSQEAPLPSSAGAAGEPGVAGGVAWARASLTAESVTIVKAWSLLSIMFPFRP
jgi:hypothetical protein